MKNTVQKYQEVFSEEAFYAGLDDALKIEIKDKKFADKFAKHLDFYQKNLGILESQKRYKRSNHLFYKSVSGVATKVELKELKKLLLRIEHETKRGEVINLSSSFDLTLRKLYGIKSVSKRILDKDLAMFLKQKKSEAKLSVQNIDREKVQKFIKLVFEKLAMDVPKIEIDMVPKMMMAIMPTASAYTFFRLDTSRRVFKVFLADRKISLARLLFVVVHEVLGHISHFDLVIKNCEDKIKLLPSISRYGLTEGVALLSEDSFFEMNDSDDFVKKIVKIFDIKDTKQLKEDIDSCYIDARVLRILRALFEIGVYKDKIAPDLVVRDFATKTGIDVENLREDLFSFLVTPGYASCYYLGYLTLRGKINLKDPEHRKMLGEFGLGFAEDYGKNN
jgi:hypothetical protein